MAFFRGGLKHRMDAKAELVVLVQNLVLCLSFFFHVSIRWGDEDEGNTRIFYALLYIKPTPLEYTMNKQFLRMTSFCGVSP